MPTDKFPWGFWTSGTIAEAAGVPEPNVVEHWPHVHWALDELDIADLPVEAGVIGTIAIETASTFTPVREAFWLSEDWRKRNLRYYPYYGRGHIQLTWRSNYQTYGDIIGADLVNHPDRALDQSTSAWVIAHYFKRRGVADAARRKDWDEVRRLVLGGLTGVARLRSIARQLGA